MSKSGWLLSALLHVGVVVAVVFGLPRVFESDALDLSDRPIFVSVVEIADESSAPALAAEPEPAPIPEPEPIPVPEPEPAPLPIVEPEPEPVPGPEPQLAALPPEPEPEPSAPEARPAPDPVPARKPEAKPAPEPVPDTPSAKPAAASQSSDKLLKSIAEDPAEARRAPREQRLDDLLKNVVQAVTEAEKEKAFEDLLIKTVARADEKPGAVARAPSLLDGPLLRKIADAIRRRVETNWRVPAGVRDAGGLEVDLRIRLALDGAVDDVKIVGADCADDDNPRTAAERARCAVAESARRAVLKASPFEVLKRHVDSYRQWRDITMTFRPPV